MQRKLTMIFPGKFIEMSKCIYEMKVNWMLDVLGCVVKKERMYEMGCWHVVKVKVHTYIMIMMMSTFFTAFRSGINQHLLFGLSE